MLQFLDGYVAWPIIYLKDSGPEKHVFKI